MYNNVISGKVVSFVSQSGDQGKSVLAQAFSVYAHINEMDTTLVCLDREHRSSYDWSQDRLSAGIEPTINVVKATSVDEAIELYNGEELYILDTPSRASSSLYEIERLSDVIVLPTTPDEKNLDLTLTVANNLLSAGADINKLIICVNRMVFSSKQASTRIRIETYNHLNDYNYNNKRISICKQFLPEYVSYKNVLKKRLTILETGKASLDAYAINVMDAIVEVLNNA